MLRVIRKELILNRTVILVNLAIFGSCLGLFSSLDEKIPPLLYAFFSSLMTAFLPAVLVAREDKFNAMALGCSLPVSRRTLVRARFLLSFAMALACVAGAFLLAALNPLTNLGFTDLFAPGPVLLALAGTTIVLTLLLPFTLRFGMKGIMIVLVGAQVLGVLLLTLVKATDSGADKAIIARVIGGVAACREALGGAAFTLGLVILLALLASLSYRVSAGVFERREF